MNRLAAVMMICGRRLLRLVLLASVCAHAGVGVWKNYTSMKDVSALTRSGHTFWAATGGGLFGWNEQTNQFVQLTSADGLLSINLTAVAVDSSGAVWAGAATGILHVYNPSSRMLLTVPDIANFQGQTDKRINVLSTAGDTLLVGTDFGLSLYKIDRGEFGDTYSHFGNLPSATRVAVTGAAISGGRIWAAITDGSATNFVTSASLASPNLLDPLAWTNQQVGPVGGVPQALAVFKGHIYVGTTQGLFYYDGAAWQSIAQLGGKSIVGLGPSSSLLGACSAASEVFTLDSLGTVRAFGTGLAYTPTSLVAGSDGNPVVGAVSGGLLQYASGWTTHFPNGPNSSQFVSVTVASDGSLWGAGGGASGHGGGFYQFNGKTWRSFTDQNSGLPVDEVWRLSNGCDGSVWASIYGSGILEVPPGATKIDSAHLYGTNVGMLGVSNNLTYVVTSGIACDSHGNVWTAIISPANQNVLAVRRSDQSWLNLPLYVNGVKAASLMDKPVDRPLAVDASDNLWAIVRTPGLKGVVCLYNGGTIDSVAQVQVTSNNGLPSDNVNTIVVDRDNEIWVGTDRGIAIIVDPSNPLRPGGIAAYTVLNGLTINSIAVDPLNQKWIATTEGVVLFSPDGTQQLASYTAESTSGQLIDDNVQSIAVDPSTGTVYFGTLDGLASLSTSAVAPRASFSRLTVYPNPYLLPSAIPLSVDGLVANSTIKILSIDGILVREVATPGGRVGFWDGKDAQGNFVASGIYIVAAYSQDGTQAGKGKVAVIRH